MQIFLVDNSLDGQLVIQKQAKQDLAHPYLNAALKHPKKQCKQQAHKADLPLKLIKNNRGHTASPAVQPV